MHNFHSFSRLTNPVIPFPLTDRWTPMEKNFETNFASRNFVNQKKDRKLKKKTDIKKYYASFRERYPRMPKDTIRHDTTKIYRVESKRASEVICTMAHECCMTVWITIPRIPIRPRDY